MSANGKTQNEVRVKVDDQEIVVPAGTNMIEAAKSVAIEIPHYCYHPNLSIAGNCRMCQVEIVGRPKLEIACNMRAVEGLEIRTHLTSQKVKDTQAATLEFILINHPLDCTVCDQAGHCHLQDYHYEYNARPSRFLEDKVHKVKAEPLGPTVVLDGERCIMCTRCVRFCDEVTKTSELGMINRGDRSVIAINQGRELNNPLSGTVVDLCPVGALTHREWRFNTRVWFTDSARGICPGCSTGCNVRAYSRDGEIVMVKARRNADVNKEWLCDEGRYGYNRFVPKARLTTPRVSAKEVTPNEAFNKVAQLKAEQGMVMLSPDLTLEDLAVVRELLKSLPGFSVSIAYRSRALSEVEKILVSPDYAANYRAAEFLGLVSGDPEQGYIEALTKVKNGSAGNLLFVGDRSVLESDRDQALLDGIKRAPFAIGVFADASNPLVNAVTVALPTPTILESTGLLINRSGRLQYHQAPLKAPRGVSPTWKNLSQCAVKLGGKGIETTGDREATLWTLKQDNRTTALTIREIKESGIQLPFGSKKPEQLSIAPGIQA